ncbi:MAG: hypothetical protein NTY15_11555 [Planctomycetota bacterium]|nr:hypothetical protein [Planctomycetota bacterium]
MSNPFVVGKSTEMKNPIENKINVAVLPFLPMLRDFLKDSIACMLSSVQIPYFLSNRQSRSN